MITFESFLCGMTTLDYVSSSQTYEEQIEQAGTFIEEANFVLIGAGAGMSAAAGARYGGTFFSENFAEFQKRYGAGPYMQDMYSAGFYPFPDEESFWGYWSKQALLGGINLDITPLHKKLLTLLDQKEIFCLSTNADGQFVRAGLSPDRIFCTQGDYFHIQCARGCHARTYDATNLFREMDAKRIDCAIPSQLVPKCPVCGGPMTMNLRCDNTFVEDEDWHNAERRFSEFLNEALGSGKHLLLLEVGVGFNTPTIIRFPFEKLAMTHDQANLIRLNLGEAMIPRSLESRAVGIDASIDQSLQDIETRFSSAKTPS